MHDHHPRYDRADYGVRRPGRVFLPEESEPEKRGLKRLHLFMLLIGIAVTAVVAYYTIREWRPEWFTPGAAAD